MTDIIMRLNEETVIYLNLYRGEITMSIFKLKSLVNEKFFTTTELLNSYKKGMEETKQWRAEFLGEDVEFGECPNCRELQSEMEWGLNKKCRVCEYTPGVEWLDETDASDEAKKKGLVHIGFGNYSRKEGAPVIYKTIDGVLTRVGAKKSIEQPKQKEKAKEDPVKKSDAIPKEEPTKKKVIVKKVGLTDVKELDSETHIYSFQYYGKPGRIKLRNAEVEKLKQVDISGIILDRIKDKVQKQKEKEAAEKDVKNENGEIFGEGVSAKLYGTVALTLASLFGPPAQAQDSKNISQNKQTFKTSMTQQKAPTSFKIERLKNGRYEATVTIDGKEYKEQSSDMQLAIDKAKMAVHNK